MEFHGADTGERGRKPIFEEVESGGDAEIGAKTEDVFAVEYLPCF